jgi:hypothetical protein
MGVIKILSYLLCVKAFPSLTTNGFYSLKSETLSSSGTSTNYLRNAAAQRKAQQQRRVRAGWAQF